MVRATVTCAVSDVQMLPHPVADIPRTPEIIFQHFPQVVQTLALIIHQLQ